MRWSMCRTIALAVAMASGWSCTDGEAPTVGAEPDAAVDARPGAAIDADPDAAAQPGPDRELIAYLADEFGLRMTLPFDAETQSVDPEGRTVIRDRLQVELTDRGAREITMEQTLFPLAEGGGIGLVLADATTGANRSFTWDVEGNYVSLDRIAPDGAIEGATVGLNADGTYSVAVYDDDGVRMVGDAVSGRRAFEIVEEQVRYREAPHHVFMAAFALAHTSPREARIQVSCADTAATPALCSGFGTFCACAPCLVLEDPAICARHCPD